MTPVEFDKLSTIILMLPSESITLIVPEFLDPTNILPASLSAICRGVSIFSANISISKPFSIFRLFKIDDESEKVFEEKVIIINKCKKNL